MRSLSVATRAPEVGTYEAGRVAGLRTAFINTGMLGHRSVARLLADCAATMTGVEAVHIDLSRDLTLVDRGIRRALSVPLAPTHGAMANLDLRRWRQELNLGLLASRRLAAAEREGEFSLLHFHTQAAAYASLGRLRRTPSIVSIDATQTLAREEAVSTLAQLSYEPNIAHDRRVFQLATAITATSEWAARDLTNHDPDCAGKVHVMPYPVRPIAGPGWTAERHARAALGRPRVLFIGGDFVRKGGDLLLDVWRDASLGAVADLELVTDWPLDGATLPRGVILRSGITAYSPEWLALWHAADVFVMPTRHEAFGMVFQEAAAAGLPAIGTRINAIPEIVRHGSTGLLVARDDRAALGDAIRSLVTAPDLRRTFGERALATIRAVASLERYTARLHAVMTDAVFGHEHQRA